MLTTLVAETFLPFQLEYAFSSGMLLSLLGAMLPSYVSDTNWQRNVFSILEEMISARNVVAPLRKAELREMEELLTPIRRHPFIMPEPTEQEQSVPPLQPSNAGGVPQHEAQDGPTDFSTGLDDTDGFLASWEELFGLQQPMANGDFMMGLAEQLELGDLESSFLLS